MKSRIQALVMLVVIAAGFSSATAVPARQFQRSDSNAQQSKPSFRLQAVPQVGGSIPPCPTGSTCG